MRMKQRTEVLERKAKGKYQIKGKYILYVDTASVCNNVSNNAIYIIGSKNIKECETKMCKGHADEITKVILTKAKQWSSGRSIVTDRRRVLR